MNGEISNGFSAIRVRKKGAKSGKHCLLSKLPHPLQNLLSIYRDLCLPLKTVMNALKILGSILFLNIEGHLLLY